MINIGDIVFGDVNAIDRENMMSGRLLVSLLLLLGYLR